MKLKTRVAPVVYSFAYGTGISRRRARARKSLRILMLHGVGGPDYPEAVFRSQMEYLKRTLPVVPLQEILRRVVAGDPGDGEVALTFDDGLRNDYTVALPILRELGLPATFYICPELIEKGRWLWNHEARERLRSLPPDHRITFLNRIAPGCPDTNAAVEWMKSLPLDERLRMEDRIREATPAFVPNDSQLREYEMMRWEEVEALPLDLITIGSHTQSHPILPRLREDDLHREIEGSRETLEGRLRRAVESFCYPNGAQTPQIVEMVRAVYRSAVATSPGFVRGGDDLYLLRRIPVPRNLPALAWRLHKPGE